MKTYKVGFIGFAHMHVMSILEDMLGERERFDFVGGYDLEPLTPSLSREHGTRGPTFDLAVEKSGMPICASVEEVLSKKPDLVVVNTENARHPEICGEILRRGIHVLVEKPMAPTLQGALTMMKAARVGGARLFINWPSTWMPSVRTAHRLTEEGKIGKLFRFHYRNGASRGPLGYGQQMTELQKAAEWWHQDAAGGGATMDYCCYGSNLARWFLGADPVAAYGMRANFNHQFADADDYGTITAQFPEAIAIVEGSWTTLNPGLPNGPIITGLEGTLVCDINNLEVHIYGRDSHGKPPQVFPADPLPAGRDNIAREVLHCLDTGDAPHPTLDLPVNLGAMMMLDAGIRSSVSRKQELAGSFTYTIGAK